MCIVWQRALVRTNPRRLEQHTQVQDWGSHIYTRSAGWKVNTEIGGIGQFPQKIMMWYQIDAYTMAVLGIVGLYLIYILLFVELRMWLSGIPAVPTTFMER